ncbi:hypothetical protein ACP275_04G156600 [Erythranthe tilingii]
MKNWVPLDIGPWAWAVLAPPQGQPWCSTISAASHTQSNRHVIPIVGMGGIGKTTLVKNAYEHSLIMQYFDIRAWATVSQMYSVREILLQLLCSQSKSRSEMDGETTEQIGEQLYKKLWGRRYVIVMDDIWNVEVVRIKITINQPLVGYARNLYSSFLTLRSTIHLKEAWEKVKCFFPINDKRSRIVVTTRISNVAICFTSLSLEMTAFCQARCPLELEIIRKEIVKKCKGLPLSIVVIGGFLGKSPKMQEYWKNIGKDLISILKSGDDCSSILSLSYTHLHVHLKPCFLYMGIFPEDHIIRVSHTIKLWVAEGFIKLNKSQSLEEIARDYLNDLIDMNLILRHSLGSNGKIQYCKIHDLLRDLCLKAAQKDKFVCMMKDIPHGVDMERPTITNNRTLVTHAVWGIPTRSIRMLRVIVVFGKLWTTKKILIQDAFAQVNLRYLDYECFLFGKIPSSITMLWNVQNLYIKGLRGGADAPSEIWEMRQLRHVCIDPLVLPDPPPSDQKDDFVLLNNLQTLKDVQNLRLSEKVCKRVLNVKTLSIQYNKFAKRFKDNCLYNCCRLQKLESLKFQYPREHDALQEITFSSSLKKLYLRFCTIKWEDLTIIGSLPHLEVLKLKLSPNTAGSAWNPIEGEFLRLKFLFIECIYLVNWNADSSHFPVLEKLVLEQMEKLEEIPLDIGEIPALGAISLKSCSESSAISAVKIAEERENGVNEGLQLQVEFFYKAQMESFLEKMERESLKINNLELKLTSNW